ncbi:hypothetical protein [Xanthomonas sp. NCPPB 1128]|uniref:hypothetical protein n=1 Tax=Xanthomonas sp. NCPPB 1128 TaxID=1775876 RepID=UPI00194F052B|nr:hypothetical protein [Xanthomonas sp. NCPPB 1128]
MHQDAAAVAQDQVDTAVGVAEAGFFHRVESGFPHVCVLCDPVSGSTIDLWSADVCTVNCVVYKTGDVARLRQATGFATGDDRLR